MRRITLFIMSTVASLVLLFSYYTSRGPTPATVVATGEAPAGIVSGATPTPAAAGSAPPPTTKAPATTKAPVDTRNVTVNGAVAQTRWGPVQVQVSIKAGKITDVTVLRFPDANDRDLEINSYALPILHDQVIAAQTAGIDGVSGATVTSRGYQQSLQSALDLANFG